jgi:hypothetical protein
MCARASPSSTRARSTPSSWTRLIDRYKRSARELWEFCNVNHPETAAWMLEDAREQGEALDWWAAGESRRRRW